jgi:cysteine synthase A
MSKQKHSAIGSLIGETPLIALHFEPEGTTIYAKCEFLNPSGSVKDRFAIAVIEDAEKSGLLKPDSIILECSSGNTGVALAMIGASKGYRVKIAISERASRERKQLIEHFGGEVITFKEDGYSAGIELTRKMAAADPRYFLPRQFENPLNSDDHESTTGQEIISQFGGTIDAFVAGFGTGGTLSGVSRALRKKFPEVEIFAMEPAEAALLLGEKPCAHFIEGIADGFIPKLLEDVELDGSLKVPSYDAMRMSQRLSQEFGLLVGTSSGANIVAALEVAAKLGKSSAVVTLLCDRAERYFSTRLFSQSDERSSAEMVAVD